jgi:tetratricopeptide (TPR) repeat protein
VLVFVLALAVRIPYLVALARTPFLEHPLLDPRLYDRWAQELARGEWLGREAFYANPLYPYYLGLIYATVGRHLVLVHLLQHVLGSLGAALLAATGERLFDRRVGLVAGCAAALYAPFVFHEGSLMIESIAPFLGVLALFLIVRAGERGTLPAWLLAGVATGVFVLARPNLTPFAGVAWALARPAGDPLGRRGARALVLFAGTLLAILPVTARNYAVSGRFVLITAHGGEAFYVGNHAGADGYGTQPDWVDSGPATEHESYRRRASALLGREVSLAESSAYWQDQALAFAASEPLAYARLVAQKAYLFLHAYEKGDNANYYFMREEVPYLRFLPISFGLVAPLAALGLWVTRRDWARMGIVPLFALAYAAGIIATFVLARYRLAVVPSLLLLAAAAVVWWWKALRTHRYAAAGAALALVTALAAVTNIPTALVVKDDPATTHNNYGLVLEEAGLLDAAAAQYAAASALVPDRALYRANLAKVELRRGRRAEARSLLAEAVRLEPEFADAHADLGFLAQAEGDAAAALREYMQAVALDSMLVGPALNAAVLLEEAGRSAEAEPMYRRALAANPTGYRENVGLALYLVRADRRCEAIPLLVAARPQAPSPATAARLDSLATAFTRECAGGAAAPPAP